MNGTKNVKLIKQFLVIEKPKSDKTIDLTQVKGVSGNEITIPCGITLGNPPAKVKWWKNGIEMGDGDEVIIKANGELVIKNTTVEHKGSYVCVAENVLGNSSRKYDVIISGRCLFNSNLTASYKCNIIVPN